MSSQSLKRLSFALLVSVAGLGVVTGFRNKLVKAEMPKIKEVSIPPSPNAPHIDEPSNGLLECSPNASGVKRSNLSPRVTSPGRVECPPGALPMRNDGPPPQENQTGAATP